MLSIHSYAIEIKLLATLKCYLYHDLPILPWGWGGDTLLMFFLHHPETPQAIKLKLSDFKDIPFGYMLQVMPVCYILMCYHGNKITKGTLQNWVP